MNISDVSAVYLSAGWWVRRAGAPGPPGSVCTAGSGLCRPPGCSWTGSCHPWASGATSRGCGRQLGLTTMKTIAKRNVCLVLKIQFYVSHYLPSTSSLGLYSDVYCQLWDFIIDKLVTFEIMSRNISKGNWEKLAESELNCRCQSKEILQFCSHFIIMG